MMIIEYHIETRPFVNNKAYMPQILPGMHTKPLSPVRLYVQYII